jgi:hypothetical protein
MKPAQPVQLFSQTDSGRSSLSGFFGVVVGDVNGDGTKDIIATSLDQRLHAWSYNGGPLPGFPVYTYDTSLSAPALGDVDGDGLPEIVFGGDMDGGQPLPAGGYLWVVNGDGTTNPGYPTGLSSEVIWSSPALADLDLDGDLDIVVGTGRNFYTGDSSKLYAVDGRSRAALPGWPRALAGNTSPSPAIANVDGDANPEVVMTTGEGRVYVLNHNGTDVWSGCIMNFSQCGHDYALLSSPVIANVDSDPTLEVLVSGERQLKVFDASNGALEASAPMLSESGSRFAHLGAAAPSVATVNGQTIIANHVTLNNNADIARGAGDQQAVYVWSVGTTDGNAPWATFRKSASRHASLAAAAVVTDPGVYAKYVDAVYLKLLGRPADASGRSYWSGRLAGGFARGEFTRGIARTPEWTGHVVDQLYQGVFGRTADAGGRAFWSQRLVAGSRVADVAASLYGSNEYFANHGGTNPSYIDALYSGILKRPSDASGRAYWIDQLNRGVPRENLARSLFLSFESNARRVDQTYADLLGRTADAAGRTYWANQLVTLDDIVLAALLTASDEFFSKSTR